MDDLVSDLQAYGHTISKSDVVVIRDRYGDFFWDVLLDWYFTYLDNQGWFYDAPNISLSYVRLIDLALTDEILMSFKDGCDLRKRLFIRNIVGHYKLVAKVFATLKESNQNHYDLVIWLSSSPIEETKLIIKIAQINCEVACNMVRHRHCGMFTKDVKLEDSILLAAELYFKYGGKDLTYYHFGGHLKKHRALARTLMGDSDESWWLLRNKPDLFERAHKLTSKYGYM
jgi:hypothetical protein